MIGIQSRVISAESQISPGIITNTSINASAGIVETKLANSFKKVGEVVVAGAAVTQIDFTGLDLGTDQLYILVTNLKNGTGNTPYLKLIFNDDGTATNYYEQQFWADNAVVGGARANDYSVSGFAANSEYNHVIFIWADVTGRARAYSLCVGKEPSAMLIHNSVNVWSNGYANVTKISIVSSVASCISVGSKIALYKVGL